MQADHDIELDGLAYRGLTAEERELFRRRVIQRAFVERDAAIHAALRGIARTVRGAVVSLLNLRAFRWGDRKRNIGVNRLLALDDRTLKRMGLSRSEVLAVVYGERDSRLPAGMTTQKGRDRLAACVSTSSAPVPRVFTSRT